MRGVTESTTGRAATPRHLAFSHAESGRVALFTGGHPEVLARPQAGSLWFSCCIRNRLERCVRAIPHVRDLSTIRSFLALFARRHGQGSGQGLNCLANWREAPLHAMQKFFVTPAAPGATASAAR